MQKIDFELKEDAIATIAKRHGLNFVALFGSQATGRVHEKSDIDIAFLGKQMIDFDAKLKLIGDFEDALNREDIEVVDLASASPTLMYVVVRDGQLLYEKGEGNFMSWKFYALGVWRETAWLRALRDRKLLEWANAQL